MTFSALRQLHAIIGDALDEIEGVYAAQTAFPEATSPGGGTSTSSPACSVETPRAGRHTEAKPEGDPKRKISSAFAYASPPPSPSVATSPQPFPPPFPNKAHTTSTATLLDFPSLDDPCDPFSLPEILTAQPTVLNAINRIVSAAGHMSAIVQAPFLTICDSTMGYHLPSCMRLLEASHVVEILREAGPGGLHVDLISKKNGVDPVKLGKLYAELEQYQADGRPELKYQGSNGIAAFVGLCTDEIQKASAYMTEAYHLAPSQATREGREPTKAPFCFAFDTVKAKVGYFGWLEGAVEEDLRIDEADNGVEVGPGRFFEPGRAQHQETPGLLEPYDPSQKRQSNISSGSSSASEYSEPSEPVGASIVKPNRFRLERFGKAMSGTESWETPGAVLSAFDWQSLPAGGTVVDVGGGIGSTTMLLATSLSSAGEGANLKFVIQDRPPVIEMGQKAWLDKSPTLLNQTVTFQVHDFFTPQPVKDASVFLLRVVLHDWPYKYALKILQQLREAATTSTKLLIVDFILPLACYEDIGGDPILKGIEGAERLFVPPPLLPNLGKANANVYWMDLTMQTMFNAQERTLREMAQLTLDAGWRIVKVATCTNSSFSYLTAIPIDHDSADGALATPVSVNPDLLPLHPEDVAPPLSSRHGKRKVEVTARRLERASSKRGTPTFGSRTNLSSAFEEALAKIGGGFMKARMGKGSSSVSTAAAPATGVQNSDGSVPALKPALTLTPKSAMKKQRSKTLSIVPSMASEVHRSQLSPTPAGAARRREATSPASVPTNTQQQQQQQQQRSPVPRLIKKCVSLAQMRLGQGGIAVGSSGNSGYHAGAEAVEIPSLPPFTFNPSGSSSSISERREVERPVSTSRAEGMTATLRSSNSSPKVPKRRTSHALFQMSGATAAISPRTHHDDPATRTFKDTTTPQMNCGSIAFPSSPTPQDRPSNGPTSDILGSPLRVIRRGSSFIRQRAHSRQVSSISSLGVVMSPQTGHVVVDSLSGHSAQTSPDSAVPRSQSPPLPPPPIPPRSMRRSSFAQLTSPLRIRSKSVVQPKGSQKREEGQDDVRSGLQDVGNLPSTPRKRSGSLAAVRARVMGVAGYGGSHGGGSGGGDGFLVPALPGLGASQRADEKDGDRGGDCIVDG